jgi:uncharacterized ferritin-like protein (DUF455 family)
LTRGFQVCACACAFFGLVKHVNLYDDLCVEVGGMQQTQNAQQTTPQSTTARAARPQVTAPKNTPLRLTIKLPHGRDLCYCIHSFVTEINCFNLGLFDVEKGAYLFLLRV